MSWWCECAPRAVSDDVEAEGSGLRPPYVVQNSREARLVKSSFLANHHDI
jgi:hypothetical protein